MKTLPLWAKLTLARAIVPIFAVAGLFVATLARWARPTNLSSPRLIWGTTPIINFSYWSRAMAAAGFDSMTLVSTPYSINQREDWDEILSERFRIIPAPIQKHIGFVWALWKMDIFFMSFDGFLGPQMPGFRLQGLLLRWARRKTVFLPYGSDAYIYGRVRSAATLHGLLLSYPGAARRQREISKRVDYWVENADFIIPGIMSFDGFGRYDVLTPSPLTLDLNVWKPVREPSMADGREGTVRVVHAPNHRGFKGTEFIVAAVEQLAEEGLSVELRLLEGLPNSEVRRVLSSESDVLVEQLLFPGHGLNALEGMSVGLPVVGNLSDESIIGPFRWYTYFRECPIVSATPDSVVDVLRELVTQPKRRAELSKQGVDYVKNHHGADAAVHLFAHVLTALQTGENCQRLYHPLLAQKSIAAGLTH